MGPKTPEPAIPLWAVTDRISEIEHSIERLRMELDMLIALRNKAVHLPPLPSAQISTGKPKKSTSDAIREVLAEHPGLKPSEVINLIDGVVESNSKDVRKTMYSIIASLRKRGHIRKTPAGRLHLVRR